MGEKNLWSKLGLITLIVGLSLWQMFPLRERLKLGIDLQGGAGLLFEIDDTGLNAADKINLAERVASILKERVDPQGNRNLVWRPIGQNRLEIQMPRPPERQKAQREAFESARDQLQTSNITESQIRAALVLPADQRQAAFAEMSKLVPSRQPQFDKLVEVHEKYEKMRAATSQPEGAVAEEMDKLFEERNKLIEAILQTNLDPRMLTDLLELGRNNEVRKKGLTQLREKHPDLLPIVDQMTAAYDDWSKVKGALDDTSDLMRLLRGAGVLEFRILAERNKSNPDMLDSSNPKYNEPVSKYVEQLAKYGPRPRVGDNYRWFKIAKAQTEKDFPRQYYIVESYAGNDYVLAHSTRDMTLTAEDQWSLKSAAPGRDQMGRINITFNLATHGKFGRLTQENLQRPLSIFLDEEAISAATIQSQINDRGEITGNFTPQYVNYVVNTLEAGALPARLKEVPLQEKTVGPSLGDTNRKMGLRASIISLLVVAAFMIVYYTYNGLITDIALLLNLVITLGVMSFLQATFTLPGIAGIILTLGMAVDANVLILERVREELQRGVSARMAVKLGYEKAFSAIFDSNLTTILTAVILFWIGSEEIKGFGLTLGLGLCISMFTALFVTRQYYYVMIPSTLNQDETRKAWLMSGILAGIGGLCVAIGWLFNREAPDESTLYGLGKFLLILFGTSAALLLTLWAFRFAYRASGHQRANRLSMMKLMSAPTIDWMGKYRTFWAISAVVIGVGFVLIAVGLRDEKLFDIEFVGGTSVQIQLKEGATLDDEGVRKLVAGGAAGKASAADWLLAAAGHLDGATVKATGQPGGFQISVPGGLTGAQISALLLPTFEQVVTRGGIEPAEGGVVVRITGDEASAAVTADEVTRRVKEAADYARSAANKVQGARVQSVEETTVAGTARKGFEIVTTETNRGVVTEAVLAVMGNVLEIKRPVDAVLVKDPKTADGVYPIGQDANVLADVIGGSSQEPVSKLRGGAVLVFDQLQPPQTTLEIEDRLADARVLTEFEGIGSRLRRVVGLTLADGNTGSGENARYQKVAIIVAEPNIPYYDLPNEWQQDVAARELALAQTALGSTQSLQRVTQFAAQVASEAAQKAVIAVVLSLLAIAAYLWVRFGSLEFGLAGILALYHDVAVALACIVASHYLWDTPIGHLLGLRDFKIDLNIIAALLTIIGYSINDSIVIFDRVRENRGRLAALSPKLLNDSVNQTLSRTILTVLTVFMVVLIMYIWGGEGIKGFAFTMVVGSISGSYSTFAISVPMLQHQKAMWMVSIVLTALTLMAVIAMAVTNVTVQWVLIVMVAVLAVALAVRYLAGTRGAPSPMGRQLAAAGT